MIKKNDYYLFGFFKEMEYSVFSNDTIEEMKKIKNKISKASIIKRFKTLPAILSSKPAYDIKTQREIGNRGSLTDGNFKFPAEFEYYMKTYDIGIPYEYEEYLKQQGVK